MEQNIWSIIMDLPFPLSYNEAQKKIQECFIEVDGSLYFVNEVREEYFLSDVNGIMKEISPKESINVWLPEPGCYLFNGKYFYLKKSAKKQWKKSFNWDYYNVNGADFDFEYLTFLKHIFNTKQKPKTFYIEENILFHLKNVIGYVKGNDIELHNPIYYQEILDLIKGDSEWSQKSIHLVNSLPIQDLNNTLVLKVMKF